MKRFLDFLAAAIGLIVLSPVLALAAAAIWLEDRHSPFFFGKRIARGGGFFRMAKFRSMVPHAWKTGVSSTAAGDRRITRVGSILRRGKLDELPQLWNVLKGEMSLVGPRPQVETDASLYTVEERRLFSVRPGITDLASIVFADEGEILAGSSDPDLLYNQIIRPWKSRLGLLYIDRRTVATDLFVIVLTLVSALSRRRALNGVAWLLARWNAEPLLARMAARKESLVAWPPPGAHTVVDRYPNPAVPTGTAAHA
jgi:lipopolysaccharide/colanic/teichoic acid biosynthesis glycosyltransferase